MFDSRGVTYATEGSIEEVEERCLVDLNSFQPGGGVEKSRRE